MVPWLAICFIAQMAILIKKIILKKELEGRGAKDSKTCNFMNTQKWNQYLCTTSQLLLCAIVIFLSQRMVIELVKFFNLNSYEKSLLNTNVQQVLATLGQASYMYGMNKAMRHHLMHDILQLGGKAFTYLFVTISLVLVLANHYHNISSKAFFLRDHYKRISC